MTNRDQNSHDGKSRTIQNRIPPKVIPTTLNSQFSIPRFKDNSLTQLYDMNYKSTTAAR